MRFTIFGWIYSNVGSSTIGISYFLVFENNICQQNFPCCAKSLLFVFIIFTRFICSVQYHFVLIVCERAATFFAIFGLWITYFILHCSIVHRNEEKKNVNINRSTTYISYPIEGIIHGAVEHFAWRGVELTFIANIIGRNF